MKNKFILLLILLGLVGVIKTSVVLADMGMPEVISYDVLVSNKNGAKAIGEDNVVIPYDTKCTVVFETFNDKKQLLLDVQCSGYGDGYILKGDDTRILSDVFEITDDNTVKLNDAKLYTLKDVEMYSGPSYKYKNLNKTIPANTEVIVTNADSDDSLWSYVEYNGTKGWIYTFLYDQTEGNVARVIQNDNEKNLLAIKDITKLYENPINYFDEKYVPKSISIPKGTILDSKYHYVVLKEMGLYYVTYNGISGWINAQKGAGTKDNGTILIPNAAKVDIYDENTKKVNVKWEKYQELAYDYSAFDIITEDNKLTYRVKYDNKYYYVVADYDNIEVAEMNCQLTIKNGTKIYTDDTLKKLTGTTDKEETFTKVYVRDVYMDESNVELYYVKLSSLEGWVVSDGVNKNCNVIEKKDETAKTTTKKIEEDEKQPSDKTTKEKAVMCIIGAIVVALVAVVTIILVNRKKNNNIEE